MVPVLKFYFPDCDKMINYQSLEADLKDILPAAEFSLLKAKIEDSLHISKNIRLTEWNILLNKLPSLSADQFAFNTGTVKISSTVPLEGSERDMLVSQLKQLHPWRKGPYNIFDIFIDTEWRSDWKWSRLADHVADLKDRNVIDVGCGNGYHCWRIFGEGARLVIGIDPYLLSVVQFSTIKHYIGTAPVHILPLAVQQVKDISFQFDTVFSMGVLYHCRSPIDHLMQLRSMLRSGGELILETLVIDGNKQELLVPEKRYAKMRNVWFVPSCNLLEVWLKRSGFKNIRLIDVSKTSLEEQRSTEWMTFESLKDFLDPQNPDLTIEHLPAPKRAIFIAQNL